MRHPFYRLVSLLALVAIAGVAWLWIATPVAEPRQQAETAREIRLDVQGLITAEAVAKPATEARQRPLFTPGRTPFVPAQPPPPIPTPPPITVVEVAAPLPRPPAPPQPEQASPLQQGGLEASGLQLKGIAINGGTRRALVTSPQLPFGQWVKLGETIAGWELVTIEQNHVFLKLGNTSEKMQLYVDNSAN